MQSSDSDGGGKAILVVDDDDDLRGLYADLLRAEGYDVVEAASGEQAIERTKTWRPHVVITDLTMPGMNGVELCEYFVRNYGAPAPSVVVVSGFAAAGPEVCARGASSFLAKPVELGDLLSVVRALARGGRPDLGGVGELNAERRQTARRVAEATFAAALESRPDAVERARHVSAWLGGFYRPAVAAFLAPSHDGFGVVASSAPDLVRASAPELVIVARNVIETGSTIIASDLSAQPWLGITPELFQFVVAVPFRYQNLPIGVVALGARAPRPIGSPDVAILEHIAKTLESRPGRIWSLIGRSGLLSRDSFSRMLEIETSAVSDRRESIVLALARTSARVDPTFGALLEHLPLGRVLLGEVQSDVVGIAVRAPFDVARRAASASVALVRAHTEVTASAELAVSPPMPPSVRGGLLEWAEHLLDETAAGPAGAHVSVLAHPAWDSDPPSASAPA